jgi:hypothetical protein
LLRKVRRPEQNNTFVDIIYEFKLYAILAYFPYDIPMVPNDSVILKQSFNVLDIH